MTRISWKSLLLACVLVGLMPAAARAVDTEIGLEQRKGESKEERLEKRRTRSREQRQEKSQATRQQREHALETRRALDKVQQATTEAGVREVVTSEALFLPALREREMAADPALRGCSVLSRPVLPADLGLTAMRQHGGSVWVDVNLASYLHALASSGAPLPLSPGQHAQVLRYRDCLADYGLLVASAMRRLRADLAPWMRGSDGRATIGLAEEDVLPVAHATIAGVLRSPLPDDLLALRDRTIADHGACTGDGSLSTLRCGGSQLSLTAAPTLIQSGVPLYGAAWGGRREDLTLTASHSKRWGLSQLQAIADTTTQASTIEQKAADLESHGDAVSALKTRSEGIERVLRGQIQTSPDLQRTPLGTGLPGTNPPGRHK